MQPSSVLLCFISSQVSSIQSALRTLYTLPGDGVSDGGGGVGSPVGSPVSVGLKRSILQHSYSRYR